MQLEAKNVHAPEFGQVWLNSAPLSLRALRGQVVLVDFWDYTCVNCLRTLPYLREWHRRYRDLGLVVVGVHAPEFYFASVPELVSLAAQEHGLEYPILLDNEFQIWQAFANRYWPSKYLIDTDGYIRYFHHGEGGYGETETAIQALLRERDPRVALPAPMEPVRPMDVPGALMACQRPTPELYCGSRRGRLANPGGWREGERHVYSFGGTAPVESIELDGAWVSRVDSLQAAPGNVVSRLRLSYDAAEVNVVLASSAEAPVARLLVTSDGQPIAADARGADVQQDPSGATFVQVARPRMYEILRRRRFHSGLLQFETRAPGLEFFAFTFVSCIEQ
jgi:thiol-disulfide isomerase/thioredoxin